MINISKSIAVLLDRMDKFPDEFVDVEVSCIDYPIDNLLGASRWGHVTEAILCSNERLKVFTAEECITYRDKLATMLRKKYEEDICKELVRGTHVKDPRQLELFPSQTAYPPKP